MDLNKDRVLQKNELSRAFKGLGHVFKADKAVVRAPLARASTHTPGMSIWPLAS